MEEIALGEMGMSFFELEEISPRSLFNKLYGFRKAHRDKWDRTRLQCYFAFSPIDQDDPEKKRLMPITEFMPFEWDDGNTADRFEELKREAEAYRKRAREGWEKLDSMPDSGKEKKG